MSRCSKRRRGAGPNRRGGFRLGASNAYTPASDPLTLLWWDPSLLIPGAVSSWIDRIAGVDAAQGTGTKQPVASSTAIGGAYWGVTSDGGDVLVANAGPVLSGLTTVTVTVGWFDTEVASPAKMILEYTVNSATTNGAFGMFVNDGGGSRFSGSARGSAGSAIRRCTDAADVFAVWSVVVDVSLAGNAAVKAVRKNGVAQALTSIAATNVAGVLANANLYFFGRGTTPTNPIIGTMGHVVIANSATEDPALLARERYVAAQGGLTI